MLVLTRQRDETIMIGDDIEITVVDIRRDGKVRLGISAPTRIAVHRKEVYESIKREREEAARLAALGAATGATESSAEPEQVPPGLPEHLRPSALAKSQSQPQAKAVPQPGPRRIGKVG